VLVPLRPSSEHILIVRALGARDRHGCHSILLSCAFREQEGHLATPLLPSSRWIRRHIDKDFETLVRVVLHTMFFPGWRHGSLSWTKDLSL